MKGLSIHDSSKTYSLQAIDGQFTGMELVAIMYAAFQQFAPEQDVGFDFSKENEQASQQ